MLTHEENDLLVKVGPGAPMGEFMREYWIPAVRSESLQADGAPKRVRILGENFVAFRATDGRVGFFDEGCPHRCTSLALARNEDNALTCIFHGWKIDVSGKVVEVPSEPPERRAEFAAKVRVRHYPVREAANTVWVYLGKRDPAPNFVDFEFNRLPVNQVAVSKAILHCSWLQAMETTIDSSHLGVLHSFWLKNNQANTGTPLATYNNGPIYDYIMQPYGFREAALRDLFDGTVYTRIREVVVPFYSFVPMDSAAPNLTLCPIPIDDEWSVLWYFQFYLDKPLDTNALFARQEARDPDDTAAGLGGIEQVWSQDRRKMKEGHWSGLKSLIAEDFAVAEAPGAIANRTREYLGSSDSTLIRFRRLLIKAVRDHQRGQAPMGMDQQVDFGRIRAVTLHNRKELNWREVDPRNPPSELLV
ncbi:MAG TPA: Rieske 2Fe-2S domain-containing protein [Candidatus Binataceae bacterium]|nr:Rieske 2Fe-2S domain-containing protein [Candidatus Binataceae bacterium]